MSYFWICQQSVHPNGVTENSWQYWDKIGLNMIWIDLAIFAHQRKIFNKWPYFYSWEKFTRIGSFLDFLEFFFYFLGLLNFLDSHGHSTVLMHGESPLKTMSIILCSFFHFVSNCFYKLYHISINSMCFDSTWLICRYHSFQFHLANSSTPFKSISSIAKLPFECLHNRGKYFPLIICEMRHVLAIIIW